MERETGVASKPCETCGTSCNAITQEDGSTTYAACTTCYPATEKATEVPPAAPVDPADDKTKAPRATGTEVPTAGVAQ